jgi:hypothetical protein
MLQLLCRPICYLEAAGSAGASGRRGARSRLDVLLVMMDGDGMTWDGAYTAQQVNAARVLVPCT